MSQNQQQKNDESKLIGWDAWFVDVPNQTQIIRYSSNDFTFESLPKDGCLGIVVYEIHANDPEIYRVKFQAAYYYLAQGVDGREFVGVSADTKDQNVYEEIQQRYVNPIIVRGIWTDPETHQQVHREMMESRWS